MISTRLIGRRTSPAEVSNANKELIDAVEKWRDRDLSDEPIKYIFLDGVCFDIRIDGSIEKVPVLVAIGVTGTGCKRVLGFQAGDKESAPTLARVLEGFKEKRTGWQQDDLGRNGWITGS